MMSIEGQLCLVLSWNLETTFCHMAEGIYAAQHVFRCLVSTPFQCAINNSQEAQLIVRSSNPSVVEELDGTKLTFKFDDKHIKIYKFESASLATYEECVINSPVPQVFHTATEGLSAVGYPRGYTDFLEDMEKHTNPHMSRSTMETLNLREGEIMVVVKVNVKNLIHPDAFIYVIKGVPFKRRFRFVVDQDGSMYMKFDNPEDAHYMPARHFFFAKKMVKFYNLQSLHKQLKQLEKACTCPIYWRVSRVDDWKIVHVRMGL